MQEVMPSPADARIEAAVPIKGLIIMKVLLRAAEQGV
jgi:hypothetical protein